MALIFSPRRKRRELAVRESRIALREERLQRISKPISFTGEPFAGFGDSAHARQIFAAVKGTASQAQAVIRDRIQGLPIGVYARRFVNGKFEDTPAFDHILQRVINNPTLDPNTGTITQSSQQMFGMIVSQLMAVGESYLLIIKNGAVPIGLQIAQPGTIEPRVEGGRIVGYRVTAAGTSMRPLEVSDVVRIWEPDPYDLFSARGVMAANADEINTDAFAQQTWKKHYEFDATPKTVLEAANLDTKLPNAEEREAFLSGWMRKFNRRFGTEIGGPAHLAPGWAVKELQGQLEAASGVQFLTFSTQQVFEAHRVSPTMVGRNVDVNRAAAETARFTFDQNAVEPKTRLIAEAFTLQLANQYPQNNDNVQLVVKYLPFISRDKEFDLRKDDIDLKNGTRIVDEVRDAREPALSSTTYGHSPIMPLGVGPYTGDEIEPIDLSGFELEENAEEIPEGIEEAITEDATPEEERSRALKFSSMLRHMRAHFEPEREWRRVLQRETTFTPTYAARQRDLMKRQTEITIRRYLDSQRSRGSRVNENPEDLAAELFPIEGWGELFKVTVVPVRTAAFVASANEATDAITGKAFSFTKSAREILEKQNFAHYVFTNQTTQANLASVLTQALDDGISADETARRIAANFGTSRTRAKAIARTEITAATQEAQIEGYKQTGVVERQMWNTSLDADVRDSHTIEGQTVSLGEDFRLSDGDSGSAPGAPSFSVGNRVNCRCFLTPVFFDEDVLELAARPTANFAPNEQPPAPLPANPNSPS